MARALTDILTELNNVYQPQKDNYNQQIAGLDPAQQSEEASLAAAKDDAFKQTYTDANRRGLAFSGIPIGEQANYLKTSYLPSIGNLKANYRQQRFNLQDALAKVGADQYNTAYGIRQKELDTEAAAQAAAQAARASAGSGFSPTFSGGSVLGADTGLGASQAGRASQRPGGGFNFTAPDGSSISAAQYAKAGGIPFTDLLKWMASKGDTGAKTALGFVGNDFGYNPNAIGDNSGLYNALVNGVTQFRGATKPYSNGAQTVNGVQIGGSTGFTVAPGTVLQ